MTIDEDEFGFDTADADDSADEKSMEALAEEAGTSVTVDELTIPELLPILPVRDTVAFPGTIIPLNVGRDKSKRLIDDVISGTKILGIVSQRSGDVEDPGIDDLYRIGTVVAVLKSLKMTVTWWERRKPRH